MRSPTLNFTTAFLLSLGLTIPAAIAAPISQNPDCGCTYPDYGPQPLNREAVELPLPKTIYCLQQFPTPGTGSINFQTDLTLEAVLSFYRQGLTDQGFTERTLTTVVTEDVFSLVFDGQPGEPSLVIQSVDLGGRININLRFEDLR